MGRSTKFTSELAAEIIERMIEGESLRSICRDDHTPHIATVLRWTTSTETDACEQKRAFREQYEMAMELRSMFQLEEILEIADDGRNDWMEMTDKGGENIGWKVNGEALQRSRLRVDTRKWAMSKMFSKRFGDKSESIVTNRIEMDDPDAIERRLRSLVDLAREQAEGSNTTH